MFLLSIVLTLVDVNMTLSMLLCKTTIQIVYLLRCLVLHFDYKSWNIFESMFYIGI